MKRDEHEMLVEFSEMTAFDFNSEEFKEGGIGTAIMNRLIKAAGHHIVEVP